MLMKIEMLAYIFQAHCCLASHFVEAIVVFDGVGEGQSSSSCRILAQCVDCIELSGDITFVSQLKLPLKIGLFYDNGA